jgi:hypothetical protein
MTTYALTHGTIYALYDLELGRFVDGREWDDADIARAFVDRSLSARLQARLEVRALRTYKLEDYEDGAEVPAELGLEPRYPAGTPEYEAYKAELTTELAKFAAGEAPYEYGTELEAEVPPTVKPDDYIVTVPRTGARANLSSIARHYVANARRAQGFVSLSCECGEGDVTIDRLASETDEDELVKLLEHSLFDHVSPRRIEARRVEWDLDLLTVDAPEDASVIIGLGR